MSGNEPGDGVNLAAYSCLTHSSLARQVGLRQNSTTRMTTAKPYNHLNRLGSIAPSPSNSFACHYGKKHHEVWNLLFTRHDSFFAL
jgi:hypothetical protein